jgi:hypothetical protein
MAEINLTKAQKDKITKAIKALNDVRKELQKQNPDKDINWYLEDSDNLNLMEEESHKESGGNGFNANYDAIIHTFNLDNSSGGGW